MKAKDRVVGAAREVVEAYGNEQSMDVFYEAVRKLVDALDHYDERQRRKAAAVARMDAMEEGIHR